MPKTENTRDIFCTMILFSASKYVMYIVSYQRYSLEKIQMVLKYIKDQAHHSKRIIKLNEIPFFHLSRDQTVKHYAILNICSPP